MRPVNLDIDDNTELPPTKLRPSLSSGGKSTQIFYLGKSRNTTV